MRFPRSLHGRLTLAYATALFLALCAFAAGSAFFLVQLYQAALDTRLRATAVALNAIGADSGPSLRLDPGDMSQVSHDVPPRLDGALFRLNGSVVASTTAAIPVAVRQEVEGVTSPMSIQTIDSGPSRLRIATSAVVLNGHITGVAAVWSSTEPLDDFKRALVLVSVIAIPALVTIAVLGAGFVTRRGLEPLRDIAALASRIEATDLSRRLNPPSEQDELGSLSATFDRMLDRLQAAFARQRRFTADASHELRAPLSVIRAEADLALARTREPEEYQLALQSIAFETDRLEDLIDDMLALARAEAGPPQFEATVDLAPLVADAASRLSAVAKGRDVRVEPAISEGAYVSGDPGALARVPLALLHNGVKYAKPGGYVRISLLHVGDDVRLVVEDDGPGFTSDGLRRATERFWRDDQGRGRDGSGLGLAIVRAIVEQSGGAVELSNTPGAGAHVLVRFPAAPTPS